MGSVTERAVVVVGADVWDKWGWGRGRGLGWTCDDDDVEVLGVAERPVGSEADDGRVADLAGNGRCAVARIDGLRRRVGGAVVEAGCAVAVADDDEVDDPLSDDDGTSSASLLCARSPFSFSFRRLGLGGGLQPSSLPSLSKSKIFAKFNPTLGELVKSVASSDGAGVANVSPVAVSTTPFIADGIKSSFWKRVTGVATDGKGCGTRTGWGGGESCVTRERRFLTSSKGVFSFRPVPKISIGRERSDKKCYLSHCRLPTA